MMISPEAYYEEYLRGASREQILKQIHSLEKEIRELKQELEANERNMEPFIMPSPLTMLKCNREYLAMAKKAYEEAGEEEH